MAATTNLLLSHISIEKITEGIASYRFVRQIGSSLGVTAAAVLIDGRMTLHSARLLGGANRNSVKPPA